MSGVHPLSKNERGDLFGPDGRGTTSGFDEQGVGPMNRKPSHNSSRVTPLERTVNTDVANHTLTDPTVDIVSHHLAPFRNLG